MSRNYKLTSSIFNSTTPDGVYFISFAVVEWLDVFKRNEYKDIVLDSLRYCQQEKGLLGDVIVCKQPRLMKAKRCNRAAAGWFWGKLGKL